MNISQKEEFRYHFAGMAMQALLEPGNTQFLRNMAFDNNKQFAEMLVENAVFYADALIAELDKKGERP